MNAINFGLASSKISKSAKFIGIAGGFTGRLSAYSFDNSSGIGGKYASPSGLSGTFYSNIFTPDSSKVIAGSSSSPYIHVYPWSSLGYGTKYTNPSTLPSGAVKDLKLNSTNTALTVAIYASPYIYTYAFSSSGIGTKYANPATLPSSNGISVSFNNTNDVIALSSESDPIFSLYRWASGYTFKFSNPASMPTETSGTSVRFNSTGQAVFTYTTPSPTVSVYNITYNNGFGTKYADPTTLPGIFCYTCEFSPDYSVLLIGSSSAPYATAYSWNNGFGTAYNAGGFETTSGSVVSISFDSAGTNVALTGGYLNAYFQVFPWSNGYGSKWADPASIPDNTIYSIKFTGS